MVAMTEALPLSSTRRRMLVLWIRTVLTMVVVFSLPALNAQFIRAMNPNHEREEMAQALEHQQRSAGERVVLQSGEEVRAIVFTRASPSAAQDAAHQRGVLWWSRLLAAILFIGALRRTFELWRHFGEHARASAPTRGS